MIIGGLLRFSNDQRQNDSLYSSFEEQGGIRKMKEYIQPGQFETLISDINQKLNHGAVAECMDMLEQMLSDVKEQEHYIDRTYIGNVNRKKRSSRIDEINRMLENMSLEQIDNVHKYTTDEYDEPNHEAEALEAIINLSRRKI